MLLTNHSRQPTLILVALLLAASMTLALLATLIHHQPVQAAPAATYVSGPILTHTTWSLAGSPYIMTDSVTVNPGITLTIDVGVTVMGALNSALFVEGSLYAVGMITNPITFTSDLNSGPSQWDALTFSSGNGILEYINFRYSDGGIRVSGNLGQVIVKNSNIYHNGQGFLLGYTSFVAPQLFLENTMIRDNVYYGGEARINSLAKLHMTNTTFNNNGFDRIHVYANWHLDHATLITNTTLIAQPGLEGYEVYGDISGGHDLIVPMGITLTLKPGVMFMMPEISRLEVGGYLEAIGTASAPITLTSALNTGPGQWGGLGISGNPAAGAAHLDHVTVRFSGNGGIGVHNHLTDKLVKIENSVIRDNNSYGIQVSTHTIHHLVMTNVTFINNDFDRVQIYADSIWPGSELITDTILTWQSGLEGYEVYYGSLLITAGVTLTLEAGTTLMIEGDNVLYVDGHLQSLGTPTMPVTITSPSFTPGFNYYVLFRGGDSYLNHTVLQYADAPIVIQDIDPDAEILIENSLFQNNNVPIIIGDEVVHKMQLKNLTFTNNQYDRIFIECYMDALLVDDVTLSPHVGLEGYEVNCGGSSQNMTVPDGITLTLEPSVTLMMNEFGEFRVNGRLQSNGTPTQPVTITSVLNSGPGEWAGLILDGGEAHLEHTTVRYGETNINMWNPGANLTLKGSQVISGNGGIWMSDGQINIYDTKIAHHQSPAITVDEAGPTATVTISNSIIADTDDYAFVINLNALHQISMSHVTFTENISNRILFQNSFGDAEIDDDVILTAQPGLEGYEVDGTASSGGLIVPQGVTLTMAAGTTLFVPDSLAVAVDGHLRAAGTATQPVTLTSLMDSPVGDGWGGLWLGWGTNHGSSLLEQAVVRYGQFDNIVVNGVDSRLVLTDTQLLNANQSGLRIVDGRVTAVCSTFANNNGDGITVLNGGAPNVTVHNSNIFNNTGEGLNNDSGITVNALNNWWGEASGPGGLGPGSGDEVSGNTLYDPWLTMPQCLPVYTADLSVNITTTASAAVAGTAVTYTLTISNSGPQVASLIRLTNTLPAQTVLIGSPPANCAGAASLICDFGNIPANEMVVLSYSVLLPITATGSLTNSAIITANVLDNNLANNTAVHNLPIITLPQVQFLQSHYSFNETDSPAFITLTLSNSAPLTSTVGYTTTPGTAVPHDDYLPSSGTITFTPGLITAVLPITLLDDNQYEPDETFHLSLSSPQNLILGSPLTATVTILDDDSAQADLSIGLTASTDSVLMGESFTYTLSISNSGPQTATAVTLTNSLPPEVTLLTIPANCTGTHTLICTWPTLAASSSLSLTYQVAIASVMTGTITNSATITAVTLDPDLSNNTADVTTTVVEGAPQIHVYLPFIRKP